MARHLNYNPARDSVEYLEAITCGENRKYILEQLLISLRAEIGRPNHQHHLVIGPRGSGKTHLLRLLTASRIPAEPLLSEAYLPIVMPEEVPLRSPGDLFLKFVERLADLLSQPPDVVTPEAARTARGVCLNALTTAKAIRNPLERLELMAATLDSAAMALGKIILPIAENMDQTFYLGAQRSRTGTLDEQWALRRHLQDTPHIFLIAAAPSIFGAVGDPGKPFYDFFRTHELRELSNDEVLEIIRLRLEQEVGTPDGDGMRSERVRCLLEHFDKKTPHLRGILAITGGLPRFTHLTYEVIVETDVDKVLDTLNGFLDDLTPYFQHRLDPRVMPQAEIDLLHTLALARGPRQPSELADELYGVPTNEVSELLSRLQEKGLVKRSGRPGGRAVTWDLTEPLYRVWTQFRDNPDGQDMYRLLGEFVALLFSRNDIEKERVQLAEKLSMMPVEHCERKKLLSRKRLMDNAHKCYSTIDKRETVPVEDEGTLAQQKVAEYLSESSKKAGSLFDELNNALKNKEFDHSSALLKELHQMYLTYADDATVWEALAKGFVNVLYYARETGDPEQSRALLDELRQLYLTHADDAVLRKQFAGGLVNVISNAAGDPEKSRALLDELRQLSLSHAEDATVRERFAKGLYNVLYDAGETNDPEQSRALLDELRQLNLTHADDAAVREAHARGLVSVLYEAGEAGELEQCRALLDELRQLSLVHTDDAAVRKWFANGLLNAIYDAGKAGDLEQGLALLNELRQLNLAYADDSAVREQFAMGLFNALTYAEKTGEQEQRRALLDELRQLSLAYADDAALRENFSMGLVNVSSYARKAGGLEQSRTLLDELRQLRLTHADDAVVREQFAMELFNAFNYARKAGDLEQSRALLDELRRLNLAHSDDAAVGEFFVKGLFNVLYNAGEMRNIEQSRTIMEEMLKLSISYPNESIQEPVQRAVMLLGNLLLSQWKAGNTKQAKEGMRWLELSMPGEMAELLRPMLLAMDVLEKGEEQALAREPEEMRRVVRMVLDNLEKK